MYIDKLIRKEVITLIISVAMLVIIFIGVTYAKFLSVDNGEDVVIELGDLKINFCNDSTCDSTYSNIGQVIGTKVVDGVSMPASIYPFKNDGTYSNETPYIFKVENTGTLDSTVKIRLKEDASFTPTGDYADYARLTSKYANHLKIAIRKRVLYQDTGYQLGDVNMDGIVNKKDLDFITYCNANNISFSELQQQLGDLNSDSSVDAIDATIILRMLAGKKTIDGIIQTYTYSYTDLEDGVIFKDDIIKAGESATYFLWLYLDETTPNDAQKTFFVGNIDVAGEYIPNAQLCKTNSELTNGTTYENGQYTYVYNDTAKSWSVTLTDKNSTDPVTSSVCTYINNIPITSMANMFGSSKATSIDLSNINTSNVTDMTNMFRDSQAKILNLSNFDTSNVISMDGMFDGSQATSLDLSGFNTSKVINMYEMFSDVQVITLDLSNFDTSKVTEMNAMFANSNIASIKGLENFNTSNVITMESMFLDTKIETLDLSNFDMSNVTDMSGMFGNNSALKTIYVSDKFITNNASTSGNMFLNCTSLVGGSGTTYNSSYIDKTYARIDGGTSNPGYFTDISDKEIPEPASFSTDSWETIVKAIKNNNTNKYAVGDTKTINLGTTYGTHTLRVANTTTPSECSTSGFSQTACGFVLEFADIITTHNMNTKDTNVGGWPSSSMRTFINNDIYNALPSKLKSGIIDTIAVSGHGQNDSADFTTTDKLYLLAPGEIYENWSSTDLGALYDTTPSSTRQLDYYKNVGVNIGNHSGAIKKYNNTATDWYLRTAHKFSSSNIIRIDSSGYYYNSNGASYIYGVSPAFRIG